MPKQMLQTSFNKEEKKIITLAALGGMLELYDFFIYGLFSVYFAAQFFPADNALISIIQSYAVFILGYLARPLGGIFFSHIGDEHGRKKALIMSILLMAGSSLGIGILPTYDQIGFLAPVCLLILRLLQGAALGGELPSTFVYIGESLPKKQGTGFGITMAGVNAGTLLAITINQLLNLWFTPQELNAYAWRIPFILGGALCFISYIIRKTRQETDAFKKIYDKPKVPILYLFKNHLPQLITGTMITSIMSGLVMVAITFMPTYLHEVLKIDHKLISHHMLIVVFLSIMTIYFAGKIADRFRPKLILWSLLGLSTLCIPLGYYLITSEHTLLFGLILLGLLEGAAIMVIPLIITHLFPAKIRLTGVALSYNLGFTLFGGAAPVIISAFIKAGYNIYLTPMIYLIFVVLICSAGLFYTRSEYSFTETSNHHSGSLSGSDS